MLNIQKNRTQIKIFSVADISLFQQGRSWANFSRMFTMANMVQKKDKMVKMNF